MPVSSFSVFVLDYGTGSLQHLCLSDSNRIVIQSYLSISLRQCLVNIRFHFFLFVIRNQLLSELRAKYHVYCQL